MGGATSILRRGLPAARRAGQAMLQHAADGTWLDSDIVRRWTVILLMLQAAFFLTVFVDTHGWIGKLPHPVSMDFVSFYAAGLLADHGHALDAYSRAAHFATEQAVLAPGIEYEYFLYPPPFLLVCAVLAALPWPAAFLSFQLLTLSGCLLVLRAILDQPWRRCIIGLLAFPAVSWVLLIGQNSFFTAGLFAAALLLLDRRPLLAGLLVAGLACKPHYALLVPLAFAAGGHWRAVAAAAAGVLVLCALSTWLFGAAIWPAYLAYFADCHADLRAGLVGRFGAMVNPYGVVRAAGLGNLAAIAAQAAGTALAAWLVTLLWHRRAALPLRAAALLAAAMIAAPMSLFYDFMFVLAALCWLVRLGRERGYPPWTATLMAACWMLPGTALALGAHHLPVGGLVAPAMLLLCWRWHRVERAATRAPHSASPPRD